MKLSRVFADDLVAILPPALGEVRGYRLPLPKVRGDQPVDQLADLALDLLRRVGNDLLLESLLDAGAIQEIHEATDPDRFVEVVLPAPLHLEQDLVDVGHPELEVANQVFLVDSELAFDPLERGEVVLQQRQPFANNCRVPLGDRTPDAERVQQLQMHASGRVQR